MDSVAELDEQEDPLAWIWTVPWSYCYPIKGTVTIEDLYHVPEDRGPS